MSNWLDQFIVHKEDISDHFHFPKWFTKYVRIDTVPGAKLVSNNLWSTSDGFHVLARQSLLQSNGTLLQFEQPVALIAYYAHTLAEVRWHMHELKSEPVFHVLSETSDILPKFTYGEWINKFKTVESASYRIGDGSGAYVDKEVRIEYLTICFRRRDECQEELPYLFEITHR